MTVLDEGDCKIRVENGIVKSVTFTEKLKSINFSEVEVMIRF